MHFRCKCHVGRPAFHSSFRQSGFVNTIGAVYALYSTLLVVGLLLTSPYWLVQMLRLGKYRAGLAERLGRVPARLVSAGDARPVLWVHAVSVGEVLAVGSLVTRLRSELPAYRVVVSTTTHTGQRLARERFGENDVFYFPIDLGLCIRPYLRALQPAAVILAETEFWPNFLHESARFGATIAVVNGRISDRSFPRYRTWRGILSGVLENVSLFLAQSEEDARRLVAIGAHASRVHISGNLKFDVTPPHEVPVVAQLRSMLQADETGPVIVAGSTVESEEPLVLDAFSTVLNDYPHATLVLATRHKERFDSVWTLLTKQPVPALRRSTLRGNESLAGSVLLLDSLGELAAVYSLADIAFVGGSLVPRGGHNILEPAHWGVATIVGPHTENFRDIIQLFQRQDAVCILGEHETLGEALKALLADDAQRQRLGARAREVLTMQRGATDRTVREIKALLARGGHA